MTFNFSGICRRCCVGDNVSVVSTGTKLSSGPKLRNKWSDWNAKTTKLRNKWSVWNAETTQLRNEWIIWNVETTKRRNKRTIWTAKTTQHRHEWTVWNAGKTKRSKCRIPKIQWIHKAKAGRLLPGNNDRISYFVKKSYVFSRLKWFSFVINNNNIFQKNDDRSRIML